MYCNSAIHPKESTGYHGSAIWHLIKRLTADMKNRSDSTGLEVRCLCEQIAAERNPERLAELLHILRVTVDSEQDEMRLRLHYIVKKFRRQMELLQNMS